MSLRRYDVVFSIGHCCATARYLRRFSLRTHASPLDWIGSEHRGFMTYTGYILDDFRGMLDPGFLRKVDAVDEAKDDPDNEHYEDVRNGFRYFHDYPVGVPLEKSFPEVEAKYRRRISRFQSILRSGKRVLLVFQTRIDHFEGPEILRRAEEIREKFGNRKIDLLVIEHDPGTVGIVRKELAPGVTWAVGAFHKREIHPVLGDTALCGEVYGRIRRKGMLADRIRRRFAKLGAKFAGWLHRRPAG